MTKVETTHRGRWCVAEGLKRRGALDVTHHKVEGRHELRASDVSRRRTVAIQVKAKTSGNWQAQVDDPGVRGGSGRERFWVLVDLGQSGVGSPAYFVMTDVGLRELIQMLYQDWLDLHGGQRPVNPHSRHVGIPSRAVAEWQDRWDQLKIF
jgi:hypothetical protein